MTNLLDQRKLSLWASLRLTVWIWLFGLIMFLIPKEATKTLMWISELPHE